MNINSLNEAQKAALAKADTAGVILMHEGQALNTKPTIAEVIPLAASTQQAALPTAPAKPSRPDGIPDKFWNAEKGEVRVAEMARSYTELERLRSQPSQKSVEPKVKTTPTVAEQKADTSPPADQQQATPPIDPAVAAKVARDAATADMARDGKISDASYEKLAKSGFDRAVVDAYVAGQKAQQSLYLNALHDVAGGQEKFKALVQWGATAYTAEESAAFDAAIRSGDTGTMKQAVEGLKARHAAEFGKASKTTITANPGSNNDTGNAFKSKAEVVAAMSDPRWTKGDPAYRRDVTAKIAAADRAGIDIGLYGFHSGRI